MKTCDSCGKILEKKESGLSSTAIPIYVRTAGCSEEVAAHLQEQLGPYEINRIYQVCWECQLRSLGVKPPE